MSKHFEQAVREIIVVGQRLYSLGLAPATAGNYSIRLNDGRIAITVSGGHKGRMIDDDIMVIDAAGKPLVEKKPSAETALHMMLYRVYANVNAILHTHSVRGVVLTQARSGLREIVLENYELLKAFPGIQTHEVRIGIPVFENTQNIDALADEVESYLKKKPETPAYLIRGHGLYAWGRDMAEAERITEAMEYLVACEIETMKLKGSIKHEPSDHLS